VTSTSTNPAPPGWYPDPEGQRQWRVWTGTEWSTTTRPYGERRSEPSAPSETVSLIGSMQRLVRYGIVITFAGLGLVVSVLAHWPGTAHPSPTWFAVLASDVGVALLMLGSLVFAFAARALQGHWSVASWVPGVNILLVNGLVLERLTQRWPVQRVVSESVLMALFVAQSHVYPWLGIVPAVIALNHLGATSALVERLNTSRPATAATGS